MPSLCLFSVYVKHFYEAGRIVLYSFFLPPCRNFDKVPNWQGFGVFGPSLLRRLGWPVQPSSLDGEFGPMTLTLLYRRRFLSCIDDKRSREPKLLAALGTSLT